MHDKLFSTQGLRFWQLSLPSNPTGFIIFEDRPGWSNLEPKMIQLAMRQLKFIFVGRSKTTYWQQAEQYYLAQIQHFLPVTACVVKDSRNSDITLRKTEETQYIESRLQDKDFIICLDEKGTGCTSPKLAAALGSWLEMPGRLPCFVLGGAYGLQQDFVQQADYVLSLSPMTFPHELARVVHLEQTYRALSILHGRKYHH